MAFIGHIDYELELVRRREPGEVLGQDGDHGSPKKMTKR
jgi:hypothetical protein